MSEQVTQPKPRSDLGIRTASGVVMMLVAIAAIWAGGWVFGALVVVVGIGVYWEWTRLISKIQPASSGQLIGNFLGLLYVGTACLSLLVLGGVLGGSTYLGVQPAVTLIAAVIGTDIGAYFAGRTFGGPKIAPRISPSKTWSGLIGGAVGASLLLALKQSVPFLAYQGKVGEENGFQSITEFPEVLLAGAAIAVAAQAGDFFESWMKRRAGVKDSGNLIPGHGGLFDRTDGLLAVAFVVGILTFVGVL